MAFHQTAISRFLKCAFVSSFVGFIVLAVGIFSPAWLTNFGQNNCTVQEGIWYSRACQSAGGPCIISSRDWIVKEYGIVRKHPVYETLNWNEFRALTAISIIGGLVVMVIVTVCVCGRDSTCDVTFLFVAGFSALLSSICVLITVLKISVLERDALSTRSWSRLVSAIGSIIQFVTTIFVVFAASQRIVRNIKSKQQQGRSGCGPRTSANAEFLQLSIIPVETRRDFEYSNNINQDGEHMQRSAVGCLHASLSENMLKSTSEFVMQSSPYLGSLPSYTELDGRNLASR